MATDWYSDPESQDAYFRAQGIDPAVATAAIRNGTPLPFNSARNSRYWANQNSNDAAQEWAQRQAVPLPSFNQPMVMGDWQSPQTGMQYYRNDFDGQLLRSPLPVGIAGPEQPGMSVAESTADLNRHRAMWAQQDMPLAPLPVGNINTVSNAAQRLINAHGIAPMQIPMSAPTQMAMQMARQIGAGQPMALPGVAVQLPGVHHVPSVEAHQNQQLATALNRAALQAHQESRAMDANKSIGASFAAYAVPHPESGVSALSDKQAEEHYSVGAEEEAQKRGMPVDSIIAYRRLGYQLAKANLLHQQKMLEPKAQPVKVNPFADQPTDVLRQQHTAMLTKDPKTAGLIAAELTRRGESWQPEQPGTFFGFGGTPAQWASPKIAPTLQGGVDPSAQAGFVVMTNPQGQQVKVPSGRSEEMRSKGYK